MQRLTMLFAAFLLFAVTSLTVMAADKKPAAPAEDAAAASDAPAQAAPKTEADSAASVAYVITYFHGNRRCATCKKLEAYSHEAVETGFADDLASRKLQWRMINYDEEANAHYAEDYGLYSQSLIVSRMVDGKEAAWTNLKKIWELVGDKYKFLTYVKSETRAFMDESVKK